MLLFLTPLILSALCLFVEASNPIQVKLPQKQINLEELAGKWIVISYFPNILEQNCYCNIKSFKQESLYQFSITDQCRRGSQQMNWDYFSGKVSIIDNFNAESQLQVSYFPGQVIEYSVLQSDSMFENLVIGSIDRKTAYILTKDINKLLEPISEQVAILKKFGYQTDKMVEPYQNPDCEYKIKIKQQSVSLYH